jgi:site-specific DNA recombinase
MRAVIYTRTAVGTGGDAIDRQAGQCRAFAAEHGWDVTGEFADDGVSGLKLSRPGLDAAMQQVRTRRCDALVTADASRLTRNPSDLASILADADAASVVIATADGTLDTSDELGVMLARAKAGFAIRWGQDREHDASAD